jgi:hypothetical protein
MNEAFTHWDIFGGKKRRIYDATLWSRISRKIPCRPMRLAFFVYLKESDNSYLILKDYAYNKQGRRLSHIEFNDWITKAREYCDKIKQ